MRLPSIILLALMSCTKGPPPPEATEAHEPEARPGLILISLDGFHPSYLDRHPTPSLDWIAGGVRAESLIPPFPSLTFPSHYTLVTGLHPERHGIVSNTFYDPERGEIFKLGDPASMTDGSWWGGEPIWNTAERQGLRAATLFWPGSEAEIGGRKASYVTPYKHDMHHRERVDQVLGWLDLPEPERPHFTTLYFSAVDSAGHKHGPDSRQVADAVRDVDEAVGWLLSGLAERDLRDKIDIVVVSDHGMASKSSDKIIFPDDHGVDLSQVKVVEWSPLMGLNPPPDRTDELLSQLREVERLDCHLRDQTPPSWHYRAHRAIPQVLCLAENGWQISRRSYAERNPERFTGGGHGWDPSWPPMHGIFVARGPRFAEEKVLPVIHAVDVYGVLCDALGIEPAEHQGDSSLSPALLRP